MAKRRILKKEISYVAGELFTEALVCKLYIPGVNQEKADALMARILDMQDSSIFLERWKNWRKKLRIGLSWDFGGKSGFGI